MGAGRRNDLEEKESDTVEESDASYSRESSGSKSQRGGPG